MNKIKLYLLISILFPQIICGRVSIPEKLIYRDSVSLFYGNNNHTLKIIRTRISFREAFLVFVDDILTDTISSHGRVISDPVLDAESDEVILSTYSSETNQDIYLRLNYKTGKFDTLYKLQSRANTGYQVSFDKTLFGIEDCVYLIQYDIATKQKEILCEVGGGIFCLSSFSVSLEGNFLLPTWDGADDIEEYHVYNLKTKTLRELDYKKEGPRDISLILSMDDISGRYMLMIEFWMDVDFNIIQSSLRRNIHNTSRGIRINMDDNYYYLRSEIDEPLRRNGSTGVWIPCRFTLPFDLCLYKIYNNQLLTQNEISDLDEWELHKLRNMVFAKHNYKFDSHYLQAFYNLFEFYSYGRQDRTKEVNDKLTVEDHANLRLINSEMNKFE